MTCDQASFLLERRWDRALSGDEERALDQHLAGCALCQAEAEAIEAADMAFQDMEVLEPPRGLVEAVAQQIAREVPAEPKRGWFWVALAMIATAWGSISYFGISLPLGWTQSSYYLAASIAVTKATSALADWAHPVTVAWKALGPYLLPVLILCAALEVGLAALWMLRRTATAGMASQA